MWVVTYALRIKFWPMTYVHCQHGFFFNELEVNVSG
jgi:hypothetical protein